MQDLAPAAVLFEEEEWDELNLPSGGAAGHKGFDSFAAATLGAEGLLAPAMCKEAFQFHHSSVPEPAAAKRKIQQYVAQLHARKGGPLSLPAVGQVRCFVTITASSFCLL